MSIATKRQVDLELDNMWWRVRERLRAEMDPRRFTYWVAPLRIIAEDEERVVIACRSEFVCQQTVALFGSKITNLVAEELPRLIAVDFVVDPEPQPATRKQQTPIAPAEVVAVPAAGVEPTASQDDPPPSAGAAAEKRRIKIEEVKRLVAERYATTVEQLESPCRKRAVVRSRQIAIHVARNLTGRSYPEIARRFGDRDHTTAIYSCEKIRRLCEGDPNLAAEIDALQRMLTGAAPKSDI